MNKHTPGPWHAAARSAKQRQIGVYTAQGNVVAVGRAGDPIDLERRIADARLIAAAPELLEALQRLLPAYREAVKLYDSNHDDVFTVAAHKAIAKATGGKQ